MNGEEGLPAPLDADHLTLTDYRLGRATTPLQNWLIALYLLVEDARDELEPEVWRAFVWIACDRIGEEAAKAVVREALEVTANDGREAA